MRVEHRQPSVQRLDAAQADKRGGGGSGGGKLAVDIVGGLAVGIGQFEIMQRCNGIGVQRANAAPIAQRAELRVGQAVDGASQGRSAAAGHIGCGVVLQHGHDFRPALAISQALQAGVDLPVHDQQHASASLQCLFLLRRVCSCISLSQKQAEQVVEHVHGRRRLPASIGKQALCSQVFEQLAGSRLITELACHRRGGVRQIRQSAQCVLIGGRHARQHLFGKVVEQPVVGLRCRQRGVARRAEQHQRHAPDPALGTDQGCSHRFGAAVQLR